MWLIREKQEKAAAKEKERQEKDREKQEKAAEREKARQQKEAEKQKEKAEKEVMPSLCCCLFFPFQTAPGRQPQLQSPLKHPLCLEFVRCAYSGAPILWEQAAACLGNGVLVNKSVLIISVVVVIVDCKMPLRGSVGPHLPFWLCIPDVDQVMSIAPRITGMLDPSRYR